MHIIAVNRYYWPDHSATAQMLTDLARHMAKHGHDVTIITSRLRYDGGPLLDKRDISDGVMIRRIATTRFGRGGYFGRVLDYVSFYVSATMEVARLARRDSLVIAKTDPPLLSVPLALLRSLKGFTLINWCQDLFPETAAALGMRWARGWVGAHLRRLRTWSMRQAAFNAVLNTHMQRALLTMGLAASDTLVLENWADAAIKPVPHDRNALRRAWNLNDQFVIGYSGNLGRAHLPDRVAALVNATKDLPGLAWLFVGGGAGLKIVRDAAGDAPNVHFKPYQERDRLSLSLSAADAHLISLDPTCEGLVAPSKLYGALAVERPIVFLGAQDGDIAQRLSASQSGCTLDPHDSSEWRRQLLALKAQAARTSYAYDSAREAKRALEQWRAALEACASPCAAPMRLKALG